MKAECLSALPSPPRHSSPPCQKHVVYGLCCYISVLCWNCFINSEICMHSALAEVAGTFGNSWQPLSCQTCLCWVNHKAFYRRQTQGWKTSSKWFSKWLSRPVISFHRCHSDFWRTLHIFGYVLCPFLWWIKDQTKSTQVGCKQHNGSWQWWPLTASIPCLILIVVWQFHCMK